ncbi:MAG: aldo/keto reductase [bacterium]|nr:aldo/keto reductase [bacterium]
MSAGPAMLRRRRFGRTAMTPSALGLGCAFFGGGQSSDAETITGVRRAIELGINYVDTSPGYEQSERRVGLALADGWRDRVYLQTKAGTHPERRGDYSAQATRWSVQNSLQLLGTDYLDSVLIHDPSDIEQPLAPDHALDELLRLKEQGIVRHVGLGVRSHAFHRRAMATGQIDIVLTYLDYNLVVQSAAEGIFLDARRHGVAVILASVFGMGLLTGLEPDEEDERRKFPSRQGEPVAHRMWDWCRQHGVNLRHLAMQFCLAAPVESIAMAGPCNQQQVEEAVDAATAIVPDEIWEAFEAEFGVR